MNGGKSIVVISNRPRDTEQLIRILQIAGYTEIVHFDSCESALKDQRFKEYNNIVFVDGVPLDDTLPDDEGGQAGNQHFSFFPSFNRAHIKIRLSHLVYVKAQRNNVEICMIDGQKHTVTLQIGKFLEALDRPEFYRISRSHIINLQYVERYTAQHVHILRQLISIGPKYRKEFMRRVKNYQN